MKLLPPRNAGGSPALRELLMMRFRYAEKPARPSPLTMLSGFFPVILFALFSNISLDLALWAGFAAAFAVTIRDFSHERRLRLLDMGSVVAFALLAFYAGFIQPGISIAMTRLAVNIAFCILALVSIGLRNPLTLQYAREQIGEEHWRTRRFVFGNYGLTAFWTFAFAGMAATDALSNMYKTLPPALDASISFILILVAAALTARFPAFLRGHAAYDGDSYVVAHPDPSLRIQGQ